MYQGEGYHKNFNCVSDLMERYYNDGARGARPSAEYRGALRNMARIAYRIAKKTVKQQKK